MRIEPEVINERIIEMKKDKFFSDLIYWIFIIGIIGLIAGLYY